MDGSRNTEGRLFFLGSGFSEDVRTTFILGAEFFTMVREEDRMGVVQWEPGSCVLVVPFQEL